LVAEELLPMEKGLRWVIEHKTKGEEAVRIYVRTKGTGYVQQRVTCLPHK